MEIPLNCDGGSGDKNLEVAMAVLLSELFELFKAKQKGYGPDNIATFGEKGLVVRNWDKQQRIIRNIWLGIDNELPDEKVDDTLMDQANYALMTILVRRGVWPRFQYQFEERLPTLYEVVVGALDGKTEYTDGMIAWLRFAIAGLPEEEAEEAYREWEWFLSNDLDADIF
ncbi:MAG: hypothetical protein GF334_03170 [Candidatus Altiarchaeales archaeon]|nr:hypothetical protein [Candidatus Altiarchaeales archaeon]